MITHANLADNLKLIVTGLRAVDDTVVVGWLPQVRNKKSTAKTLSRKHRWRVWKMTDEVSSHQISRVKCSSWCLRRKYITIMNPKPPNWLFVVLKQLSSPFHFLHA